MDTSSEQPRPRGDSAKPTERKGTPRPAPEGRRKKPPEGRYVGWGDGLDREFCARAEHILPATFPVASHAGAATIATVVVARRTGALLLCSFSHCGDHAWPNGEVVEDRPDTIEPTSDNP